ncbi:glycosyl hydrolases family 18-domain-containing protein [Mycena vulgaris]|nr:glycosyl hydrolases family 18-domain-containing protein [Mycena vulgaris]
MLPLGVQVAGVFTLTSFAVAVVSHEVFPRANCTTTSVVSGDGCASLATRCGLSGSQFESFNPGLDCSKLAVDQWVCCTSGTLPSKRPNSNPDGSCYSVEIRMPNSSVIPTAYEIDTWNAKTWRWTGCQGLQPGMNICLSTGTPKPPAQNASIPCGLESVGNKPCPLNGCCGKWGFCGLTDEFCEENKGGAPGTGCQSNCQLLSDFDNVSGALGGGARNIIGYYSNWASTRTCDGVPSTVVPAVRPRDLDPFAYSHLVYSFASVSRGDWKLVETQGNDREQIQELQALKQQNPNLKTMWAVGGWAFNDPPTQDIFSQMASTPGNRATFIANVLSQLADYGFDGIDIDWEYPGVERGGAEKDGENFASLLKEMQAASNSAGRRLVITFTAPASFWYLQQFNIVEMSNYADWINLMTYVSSGDLSYSPVTDPFFRIFTAHGTSSLTLVQCRREHAGVKLSKINLGIGFYGRTFTLADPSCKIAGCPLSGGGIPGPCTKGEGFLSYGEIDYLIQSRGLKPEYNASSQTMVLQYDDQWIGYEDPYTIAQKLDYVLKRAMPGVLIWAVDLDKNANLLSAVVGKSLIPVTNQNDCPAQGVWPRTPFATTASLPCDDSDPNGPKRSRRCGGPDWGDASETLCGLDSMMLAAFGHCSL